MQIKVTRTHIRRGEQNTREFCPIALAIKESLSAKKVEVDELTVSIGQRTFDLPVHARNFITAFDQNKASVEPMSFEL